MKSHKECCKSKLEARIRELAYGKYEMRGQVPGNDIEDWLWAEEIVDRGCIAVAWKRLQIRFHKFNPPNIVFLWALIIICMAIFSWAGASLLQQFGMGPSEANLCAISFFFFIFTVVLLGRFYNMQVKAFLQIISVLLTAGALLLNAKGLFVQNVTLQNNLKQSQLVTRPLLSISLTPRIAKWDGSNYFGGSYVIQNSASFPATRMQVRPVIYYDTGQADDFEGWYAGTYGNYPDISFIAARSSSDQIVSMPSVKSDVNFASIVILLTYQGFESKRDYWQMVRKTYRLHWVNGELKNIYPIEDVQISDDNSNDLPPSINPPNFKSFNLVKLPDA